MFDFGKGPGDSNESIFSGAESGRVSSVEAKLEGNWVQKRKLVHLLQAVHHMILETGGISDMESVFAKGVRKEYRNWGIFQNRKKECKTMEAENGNEGQQKDKSQTDDWGRREG